MITRTLILILWVLSAISAIWLQFRYKDANYPNDWRWRMKLFLSGGATGALGVVLFLLGTDFNTMLIAVIYEVLFLGLLFSSASPFSMKRIYPKRPESQQGIRKEESESDGLDFKN